MHRLFGQLSHRNEARPVFAFCPYFIAKRMVISEDFLTSGPSGLMTRLFFLFLSVNCGSVFNFKESGMDEFLSVKNLLIAPLC